MKQLVRQIAEMGVSVIFKYLSRPSLPLQQISSVQKLFVPSKTLLQYRYITHNLYSCSGTQSVQVHTVNHTTRVSKASGHIG